MAKVGSMYVDKRDGTNYLPSEYIIVGSEILHHGIGNRMVYNLHINRCD